MKKLTQLKNLCKVCMLWTMLFASGLHAKDIYVAKNGNDTNPGTATQPYKTIAKASATAQPGDVIIIGGGTYEETIRPARSGVAGRPIVYTSKQGEKVIISAMQALKGWQKDNGAIYKIKVNWDLGQENFVMNGNTAMDLARWPNNTDGKPFTLNSLRNDSGSGSNVVNGAYLTSSKIPNIDWRGGSVFFYGDKPGSGWIAWKAFITSSAGGRVNFKLDKNPSWIRTFHAPADKGDFYLEGVKGALDYQNEWWFNSNTKELFVQMPGGIAPVDGKVQMRKREITIDLNGRSYIEIKNLAVFGGAILLKTNSNNNKLYGVSSFYGNHTQGIFRGFNAGKPSVEVNGTRNVVEKCEIAFSAATGVRFGGKFNILKNNYIHDFNYLGSYDAPLVARGGTDNKIIGNTIFNGGRDGINYNGNRCEVAYNDVYRSNLIADDCATFYTVGGPQNTEIHHNWFHDSASRGSKRKAAGIYLDNDAEAFSVHHNVVWNVEWTGVQINWNGKDIDIFNNTLVKTAGGAMGAWHKAGTFFTNVKVWNNIADVKTVDDPSTQEDEGTFERDADKQNNVITKSGFTNYSNNKFTLTSGSPAVNAGRQISGITNGYVGSAPDAGAYEFGGENWVPGIDWNPALGPTGQGCYGLPGENCTVQPSKPTISFKTPTNNTQINAGSSVVVEVNASDADGSVSYVELFLNDQLVRRENAAPYQWGQADQNDTQLDNLTAGQYKLRAVAQDNDGNSSQSEITITVNAPNTAPVVSFLTPQDGTQLNAGSSLPVEVSATDADGSVSYVELFLNNQLVRRENLAPYQWGQTNQNDAQLTNLAVGEYELKAVAYDNEGKNTEALRKFKVNNPEPQYDDKVSFENASTTIAPANSYTFDINYEASTDREIIVEFWSSTNWIAQQNEVVAKGKGVKTITVNLPSLPQPGSGYIYKLHIRPLNTTWQDALDRDQVNNVVVEEPFGDKVSFNDAPTSVIQATSYTFKINYEASTDREIAVEFWSSNNWLGQQNAIVSRGSGVETITVSLANLPNPGADYVYKVHIRPLNTTWREWIDRDLITGVAVTPLNTQIIPDGTYFITSPVNNQRLLSRALEKHSARMITPGNFDDQKWEFVHIADDVYTIKNTGTNRYLEVPYAACSNGINVATWINAVDSHKQWKVEQNGEGIYAIKPKHCLSTALDRAAGAVDANVIIWGYSANNTNQKWRIIEDTSISKSGITKEIASLSNTSKIYPNPVIEMLNIETDRKEADISIFDMLGRRVLSRAANRNSKTTAIDVSVLQSGSYFLKLTGSKPIKFYKQ